jgi:hypothetical protein
MAILGQLARALESIGTCYRYPLLLYIHGSGQSHFMCHAIPMCKKEGSWTRIGPFCALYSTKGEIGPIRVQDLFTHENGVTHEMRKEDTPYCLWRTCLNVSIQLMFGSTAYWPEGQDKSWFLNCDRPEPGMYGKNRCRFHVPIDSSDSSVVWFLVRCQWF